MSSWSATVNTIFVLFVTISLLNACNSSEFSGKTSEKQRDSGEEDRKDLDEDKEPSDGDQEKIRDEEDEKKRDEANGSVAREEPKPPPKSEPSSPLPKDNPMEQTCRSTYRGLGELMSGVQESFEWDFRGNIVTGKVTYARQGQVLDVVYVRLSFRERNGNEYFYNSQDIQSTGRTPNTLSFSCYGTSMTQRENWQGQPRTFQIARG
jgi:hypothetical protein